MKYVLFIAAITIVLLYSCTKADSADRLRLSVKKVNIAHKPFERAKPGELQKSYNALVAKLTAGNMNFKTFYSELKKMLAPYKWNNRPRNLGTFPKLTGGGAWNYTPAPCDFENDPVGCSQFWYTDCMSYCQDQYFIYNEAWEMEEEAATADYWNAQQECEFQYSVNPTGRDSCLAAASAAFTLRMAPVIAGYDWCNNQLYQCETISCGAF